MSNPTSLIRAINPQAVDNDAPVPYTLADVDQPIPFVLSPEIMQA